MTIDRQPAHRPARRRRDHTAKAPGCPRREGGGGPAAGPRLSPHRLPARSAAAGRHRAGPDPGGLREPGPRPGARPAGRHGQPTRARGTAAAGPGGPRAGGVLRGHPSGLRPSPRPEHDGRVPSHRAAPAAVRRVRAHDLLHRAGHAGRSTDCGPGRGDGVRHQPTARGRALPPGAAGRREPGGYLGGLDAKRTLLDLERRMAA